MANNVQVGFTFATQSGPIPLNELDTNFSALQAAINSMNSYTNYLVDTSGAANVITVTLPVGETGTYVAGLGLQIQVANTTSTTTPTINLSSLGTKTIINADGSSLIGGQIVAGQFIDVIYDGTSFRLMSQGGTGGAGSFFKNLTVGPCTNGAAASLIAVGQSGAGNYAFKATGGTTAGDRGIFVSGGVSAGDPCVLIYNAAITVPILELNADGSAAFGSPTGGNVAGSGNVNVQGMFINGNPVYSGTPPRSVSGAVTPVLADNGKYLDCSASTAITLPLNSSVAYPIGAIIGILADFGSGTMTVAAGAGDTLFMGGSISTTGTRTIAPIGWATLLRLSTTQWVINGSGVT